MAAIVKRRTNRHLVAWSVVILVALYFIVPVLSAAEFAFRETTDDAGNNTYGIDSIRLILAEPLFLEVLKVTGKLTVIAVVISEMRAVVHSTRCTASEVNSRSQFCSPAAAR